MTFHQNFFLLFPMHQLPWGSIICPQMILVLTPESFRCEVFRYDKLHEEFCSLFLPVTRPLTCLCLGVFLLPPQEQQEPFSFPLTFNLATGLAFLLK